jgi:hypothetical protein
VQNSPCRVSMAWAACCSNKQMQDLFFGESNQAMFKAAAAGRREAGCQWCYEHVQVLLPFVSALCDWWLLPHRMPHSHFGIGPRRGPAYCGSLVAGRTNILRTCRAWHGACILRH